MQKQKLTWFIVRTALTTLVCLLMIFSYSIALFGFIFPAPMVRMSDGMGLARSAAMYQEIVYRRDPTLDNLYSTINRHIAVGSSRASRIIALTEIALQEVEPHNLPNRFRRSYVASLLHLGRAEDAKAFVDYARLTVVLGNPCTAFFQFDAEQRAALHGAYQGYIIAFSLKFHDPETVKTDIERAIGLAFLAYIESEGFIR